MPPDRTDRPARWTVLPVPESHAGSRRAAFGRSRSAFARADYVLVVPAGVESDAAQIERLRAAAVAVGAASAGRPVTDTVKLADDDGFVDSTPDRASLRRLTLPQAFRADWLLRALAEAPAEVDDLALAVLAVGLPVRVVE